MDIALNWKDYFPKVDKIIENLISNLNKEADMVEIENDYAELKFNVGKKIYVSPRGSIRSFKIDGKPVGNTANAAYTLQYGNYQIINILEDIKNTPELFSFVPITKDEEIRYTVSKYSPFFEKYFNANATNIEVIYTFGTMFVRSEEPKGIKAYLFDLGTDGLSVHQILKNFCKSSDLKYDPYKSIYIGTIDKISNVIAVGYNKAGFRHIKAIKNLMRFFETNFIKYLLAYDYDVRKKSLDTIKSYVIEILIKHTGVSVDDICYMLLVNKLDLYNLIKLKTTSIENFEGNIITLDEILDMLRYEEKISKEYGVKSNLLREVKYEEIPN